MTRHHLITSLALIGAAVSLALGPAALAQQPLTAPNPTVKEVHVNDTVHITRLPDHVYLRIVNDPDSVIWDHIPIYRALLTTAPPVHRSIVLRFNPKEKGEYLYFQLARTAERFYVRLRWQDSTQNRKTTVNQFRDGAAIQYSLNGVDTSYMMGSGPKKPVNIWYWRPDRAKAQDLAAGGFGSLTMLPKQSVSMQDIYYTGRSDHSNEWRLVMSREINSTGKDQVGLQKGTIPIAFAVWQGATGQRDGQKRVTKGWILLDMHPTPTATELQQRAKSSEKKVQQVTEQPSNAAKAAFLQSRGANGGTKGGALSLVKRQFPPQKHKNFQPLKRKYPLNHNVL